MAREPENEAVLDYAPGSRERADLRTEINRQSRGGLHVPLRVGHESRHGSSEACSIRAPHRHSLVLGEWAVADREDVSSAIDAALSARASWATRDQASRSAIFLRAAELLAGPYRQRLNAATLLGQSKTVRETEIDAACELIDFFRFNAHYAERLGQERLISPRGQVNSFDLRPLEGFVYAITPFNFTSIAGNLPSVVALLGNTVVWKPSPYAMLSAHYLFELFAEAGLPDGVINLVAGDAEQISNQVIQHPELAGIHFTGSTPVFRKLFRSVGEGIAGYRSYPRLVGETGGKDFIVAHSSADLDSLAVAVLRGGFEYQGQKCSASSRVYVPRSLAAGFKRRLNELLSQITLGDPAEFSSFMAAVIGRPAFDRLRGVIDAARGDTSCRIAHGGGVDDSEGFFIEPTLIEVMSLKHALLRDELFGPIVAYFVYDDDRFESLLSDLDRSSAHALTGAIFARERAAIDLAARTLRETAGNFYINDKPTGAVVGQQPFGGGRHSGTNDKAGSPFHLLRWLSPRVIKENFAPPRDYTYPFLLPDAGEGPAK